MSKQLYNSDNDVDTTTLLNCITKYKEKNNKLEEFMRMWEYYFDDDDIDYTYYLAMNSYFVGIKDEAQKCINITESMKNKY